MGRLSRLAALSIASLGVWPLTSCTTDTDPTIPCGALELGAPDRAIVARSRTVLAFTEDDAEGVTIVKECRGDACPLGAEISLEKLTIEALFPTGGDDSRPDAILVSGTGQWMAYTDGNVIHKIDLESGKQGTEIATGEIEASKQVVGTLRSDDWVVLRDDGRLLAIDLDTDRLVPLGDDPKLLAVALGDRTIVARRIIDGEREALYLIRVNPTQRHDNGGHAAAGKAIFLTEGKAFSRVLITRGPTPAELGETDEPYPDTPIDEYVIATSGSGADAITIVFRALDGEPIDSFRGAARSGQIPLEEVPGLSAVSADSSRLAYVTSTGALAIRNLHSQGACLVRAATEGDHTLAGFAADGTLYFESREDTANGHAVERVAAYEPGRVAFRWLSMDALGASLKAVPFEAARTAGGTPKPWAISSQDGLYAVQDADDPQLLGLDPRRVSFVPRKTEDQAVWLLEAADDTAQFGGVRTRLRLKKIRAADDPSDDAMLEFDAQESDPVAVDDDGAYVVFERSFTTRYPVCVSPARPGGFGARCGSKTDPVAFLRSGPEPAGP